MDLLIAVRSAAAQVKLLLFSAVRVGLPHQNLGIQTGQLSCVGPRAVFHYDELEGTAAFVIVGCLPLLAVLHQKVTAAVVVNRRCYQRAVPHHVELD